MKVRITKLSKKQRIETLDMLYTAASAITGRDAMKLFLRDLLTESERIMLGRRILIARRLIAGHTHRAIEAELGAGKDTIWKVQRWLSDTLPGYEQALQGLEHELRKRQRRFESKGALASLKRKYPLHFLLFPWPKGFSHTHKKSGTSL